MQEPLKCNNILFKKWCDRENVYMSKRLKSVKALVNMQTPESYVYAKNRIKSSSLRQST